jgi:nitrogen fixation protein NifU and related proteins
VFSELLLDHFRHPRNAGELPGATVIVEVTNPVCGDVLRLAARVEDGQ